MNKERSEKAAHEKLLIELRERFEVESDLIQIPVLAQIVGVKKATLYSHARAGKLFLPCRYVNSIPLVRLTDLVAWIIAETQEGEEVY